MLMVIKCSCLVSGCYQLTHSLSWSMSMWMLWCFLMEGPLGWGAVPGTCPRKYLTLTLIINISNLSPLTNKAQRMVRYELMIEIIVTRQWQQSWCRITRILDPGHNNCNILMKLYTCRSWLTGTYSFLPTLWKCESYNSSTDLFS